MASCTSWPVKATWSGGNAASFIGLPGIGPLRIGQAWSSRRSKGPSGNRLGEPGPRAGKCPRLVEEDGAIAVCCDLAAPPGPALQRLIGAPSREEAVRQIRRDNPRDALPALQLARALETSRIYLLSRLDPGLVEDLEMIPIAGPEELARLAQRSDSCLVLANAVHAMVQVEGE